MKKKKKSKHQIWWETTERFLYSKIFEHGKGYCGNQMCCWGKPGDRVKW